MANTKFRDLKVGDRFHWRTSRERIYQKAGASTYKLVDTTDERFKSAWPNWADVTYRVGSRDARAVKV